MHVWSVHVSAALTADCPGDTSGEGGSRGGLKEHYCAFVVGLRSHACLESATKHCMVTRCFA